MDSTLEAMVRAKIAEHHAAVGDYDRQHTAALGTLEFIETNREACLVEIAKLEALLPADDTDGSTPVADADPATTEGVE